MKNISLLLALIVAFCLAESQTIPAPLNLRTDLLLHTNQVSSGGIPVNRDIASSVQQKNAYQFAQVFSKYPNLHWEVDTAVKQLTAYRVLVASTAALINKNSGDVWDSKKINSTHSGITYAGKQLEAGKVYYWKVQVWNEKYIASPFSVYTAFYVSASGQGDNISHLPLAAEWQSPEKSFKRKNESHFFDFGKDAFAQLHLQLNSEKNDSIWIEAAEALDSSGGLLKVNGNIRYTRRSLFIEKGAHDYTIEWPADAKRNSRNPIPMPNYIGEVFPFRYVTITNYNGVINKESVRRKIISYPFNENASGFTSNDTVLNKVWDLCRYSVKATSFTGYYVDGDRERLPYEADALINQLSHYSTDAEYSMARRSMAFLLFHPTWPTEWSLQNIILAWNDYVYTGDDSFLKMYYAELQKKILMPLAADNRLISTRTGKQTGDFLESIHMVKDFDGKHGLKDNVDWPQKGDYIGNEKEYGGETDGFVYTNYNSVINAWYYFDLILMRQIAHVLGKPEDAKMYSEKGKQVYQSFRKEFANPQTGLIKDGDSTVHTSLHANMFALAFGLVPPDEVEKVCTFIKSRGMACSVYGAQFLLDALYDAGQQDYALDLLTRTAQRSWYNMIRIGSTITMEAWDKLYKPNLDLNHAWGAAPANLIVRKLMGVFPLTPGWETFQIKPQLGKLASVYLKTSTIKGTITVSCKKNTTADITEVTIPGASNATIVLSYNPQKPHLIIDGKRSERKQVDGYFTINNMQAGKHVIILQQK
ncbi:MAG: alpha-L-rhamnosidase C-terminal domain-containing protein [Bacteroidota bacterium]